MMMRSFNFVPLLVIFLASARIEIVARGFTLAGDDSFSAFHVFCFVPFRGRKREEFFSFLFPREFGQRFYGFLRIVIK